MAQTQKTRLDNRDLAMLRMVADGKTFAAIGRHFGLTEDSATKAFARARARLGALTAAHAVHIAHQRQLLPTTPARRAAGSVEPGRLDEDQLALLTLSGAGLSQDEIAALLATTREAVNQRHRGLREVLGARNLTHAIAIAYETGQLPAGPRE